MSQRAPTSAPPRVLVVSERDVERWLAFTNWTEGEDLLRGTGGAELYRLDRQGGAPPVRARRLVGRTVRRTRGAELLLPARSGAPRLPGEGYDVAVAVLNSIWNVPLLEAVPGLRTAADGVVGWFPEVWPSQLHGNLTLEPFALLDEIFVGEPHSAERLSRLLRRPVHFLPLATDVEVFSGAGRALGDGTRPIDVLNIGRRDPAMHDGLRVWAGRTGAFYLYDTTSGATATDPAEHRRMLAELFLRTDVKIASYAKYTQPAVIGDLRWVPSRVYDGLASGTVLAGYAPSRSVQLDLFGREVVHPLREDGMDPAGEVIRFVGSERAEERRDNVRTAMAAHDWSHRWVELFRACGIAAPPQLAERAARLTRQATSPVASLSAPVAGGR